MTQVSDNDFSEDSLSQDNVIDSDAAVFTDEAGSEQETSVPQDEVSQLRAEVEKWKDVAARCQADLDNFRKRMAREKSEAVLYGNRGLLEQLLPIIDNFEMGLKAAESTDGSQSMIFQGMSMVYKQISDFLSDQGVQTIEADHQVFDPNLHEAIKQEASDTVPEGHVICTLRRGYRMSERLLRPSNVIVSSGAQDPN